MTLGPISVSLWYLGIALKFALVGALVLTRAYRHAPIFTAYAAVALLRSLALWYASVVDSYKGYFYSYWVGRAFLVALGLAVVWEIYTSVFGHFPRLQRWTQPTVMSALILFLVLSVASVAAAPPKIQSPITAALFVAERSSWIVQSGLVVLIVMVARVGGLSLRILPFGIALGMGLQSLAELGIATILADGSRWSYSSIVAVQQLAFLTAAITWIVFVLRAREPVSVLVPSVNLSAWNDSLARVLRQK